MKMFRIIYIIHNLFSKNRVRKTYYMYLFYDHNNIIVLFESSVFKGLGIGIGSRNACLHRHHHPTCLYCSGGSQRKSNCNS